MEVLMTRYLALLLLPFLLLSAAPSGQQQQLFKAKDYTHLIGMEGFETRALEIHFKLYQGYVARTNELLGLLRDLRAKNEQSSPCYADIKRRLMWEYDGMRLHEFYFDNLGGAGTSLKPDSALYQELVAEFGSYQKWETDFKATGAMRGIGWAVLIRDPLSGRLINTWVNEHDQGHLPGGDPILIMDVFEHAYIIDYGLDRKGYITAFFNQINWPVVEERFSHGS